jgi:hypothetical protein
VRLRPEEAQTLLERVKTHNGGAERIECRHKMLAVGQRGPWCGQGNLYELPPGFARRIDGHALLSAVRYALHKLRCAAGGHLGTAGLPEEAGEEQDSARARAVLVVSRYALGLPLSRLQGYQAMLEGAGARRDAVGPDRAGR